MTERLTMIEDYIPVEEISYESSREKVARRRNGHLSTLHLWWARRPLAASRAAIYATFAPPATGEERKNLGKFFEGLCHWTGPILPERAEIKAACDLVSTAANGKRPVVLDMFAGGGAIPLEALRLGADAIALDLNPVAHLIQLGTLVYPQKYGKRLHDAVAKWGTWVIERTRAGVGDLYPDIELDDGSTTWEQRKGQLSLLKTSAGKKNQLGLGDTEPRRTTLRPIAYLWTRAIPSPARGYEKCIVPLVRQTWLRKKPGRFRAVRATVNRDSSRVEFTLVQSAGKTEADAVAEWGFDPGGTSSRGTVTCPFSGATITTAHIKAAALRGEMTLQLLAIVGFDAKAAKTFVSVADAHGAESMPGIAEARLAALQDRSGIPPLTEPLPPVGTLGFRVQAYGLTRWGDMFTPRQALTLTSLCAATREAHQALRESEGDEFAAAVAAYLGLLVGRVADRSSTACRWENTDEKTANTFPRPALGMVWDFSEVNPFGGSSGDAAAQLQLILDVIDHAAAAAPDRPARVLRGIAQKLPLPDSSVDAVITDPPYYDNVPYADLSDFFYVWHRRALQTVMPEIYATELTPKKQEAIAEPKRQGGKQAAAAFYTEQMSKTFAEACRVLVPGGTLVVVYAHKTTLGWSTLVDSLREAGFRVSEAWPLNTEMPERAGQQDKAGLATSIFLVAKKRERLGLVGNYATEVRPEMVRIVEARVRELMEVGVSGADLVIACVGAGLRPYTRFDRVELPNGAELPSARFLDEVQREVLEAILAAVFQIDRSGVGQVDKASRFYILGRYQYGLASVAFGEINVLAQGLGIELSGVGSLADGRAALVQVRGSDVTLSDFAMRGADEDLGLPGPAGPAPLIDVLQRVLWLMENDRSNVGAFLDRADTDAGRLRLLADALKGRALSGGAKSEVRTDEQKAVDRLLAQWARVVESRAMPLLGGA